MALPEEKSLHEMLPSLLRSASPNKLKFYGDLMKKVHIPAGHDEIVSAWRESCRKHWGQDYDDEGVTPYLLKSKAAAEAKAKEPKKLPLKLVVKSPGERSTSFRVLDSPEGKLWAIGLTADAAIGKWVVDHAGDDVIQVEFLP